MCTDDKHHHHHHDHDEHSHNRVIEVKKDILSVNQSMAERNRGYFDAKEICAINIVSSPGSGKTTLLEQTIQMLKNKVSITVIEGDQETSLDANRIAAMGVDSLQINTENGCHLDAKMINDAVKKIVPKDKSLLFIENVGNLVCPAMFDLGENRSEERRVGKEC